jgi:AraC-like DNA-binding protein
MPDPVVPVRYRSHDTAYRLDVEVLDAAELRSRVAAAPDRGYERTDFQCFVFVRSGSYTHTVDFEVYECSAGSCVLIRPGQVHRFGPPTDWDGWTVIAAPRHVPDAVADLPQHVRLDDQLASAVDELLARMASDAQLAVGRDRLDGLLAMQTRVLAARLALGDAHLEHARLIDPTVLERHREFRTAVEREFRRWRQIGPYARHLGYSPKSLDRSCRAVAAMSAKRLIVERVVLEAKRLLAHTDLPVASISHELGFDEPTNFVKYVRRETGSTPTQLRAHFSGATVSATAAIEHDS